MDQSSTSHFNSNNRNTYSNGHSTPIRSMTSSGHPTVDLSANLPVFPPVSNPNAKKPKRNLNIDESPD